MIYLSHWSESKPTIDIQYARMWPLLLLSVRLEYRVAFTDIALQDGFEFIKADVKVRLELVKIGLEPSKLGLDLMKVVHDWRQDGLYSSFSVIFQNKTTILNIFSQFQNTKFSFRDYLTSSWVIMAISRFPFPFYSVHGVFFSQKEDFYFFLLLTIQFKSV